MRLIQWGIGTFAVFAVVGLLGCGDDDDDGPSENAGSACGAPAECYPNVEDKTTIKGEVICLDKVPGGYCTHLCTTDADCCAADAECRSGHPQVCAPFESTGQTFCFLSCEEADWKNAGSTDENAYCQEFANSGFNCRSTGGGSANRKVCAS